MMKNKNNEVNELVETVVDNGYCIGCGACATIKNSPMDIKFDKYSKLQATVNLSKKSDIKDSILEVCPFSDKSVDETLLGRELFKNQEGVNYDEKIGFYKQNYAAHVLESNFRTNGSSGGVGTWILTELLNKGLVDSVIHVQENLPTEDDDRLFKYTISRSVEEIKNGAKSRYYPIELSEVINLVRSHSGKYAIVGLPCFIKSIRLLSRQDSVLQDRIKFCIGLVCGHLKSANFGKMWGWQVGVHPSDLKAIDFRVKLEGHGANNYGISAVEKGSDKSIVSPPLKDLYGGNWGWGLFKYKACDFCDDVVAETADLTIGDAWLPKYVNDVKGTNIVIVRNKLLFELLEEAKATNRIKLDNLSSEDIIASQSSGFNHRREGLDYRLSVIDKLKEWRPRKRSFQHTGTLDKRSKRIQDLRVKIFEKSHLAFVNALEKNSFDVFQRELSPYILKYKEVYIGSIYYRALNKIKKIINK